MMIIVGQKLCGCVDQVPGKCYVKTRFLHFYYVPVIPLSSWAIAQGSEKNSDFQGQQIPLSWKSILFGWLQTWLVIFGAYSLCVGTAIVTRGQPAPNNGLDGEFKVLLGCICLVVWMLFTIWPFRANERRAIELTSRLGIPFESSEESFYHD